MTIALVQSTSKSAGAVSSSTLAFSINVTAGSFLVIHLAQASGTATYTASDNVNGSWTQAAAQQSAGAGTTAGIFYFKNAAAGATTVSFSSTATAQFRVVIEEWSGVDTSSPLDQTAAGTYTSTTTPTSPATSATTAAPELVLVCYASATGTATFTAGSGYTTDLVVSTSKLCVEYQIVAVQGTQTGTCSLTSIDTGAVVVATFKASGAVGSTFAKQQGMLMGVGS